MKSTEVKALVDLLRKARDSDGPLRTDALLTMAIDALQTMHQENIAAKKAASGVVVVEKQKKELLALIRQLHEKPLWGVEQLTAQVLERYCRTCDASLENSIAQDGQCWACWQDMIRTELFNPGENT